MAIKTEAATDRQVNAYCPVRLRHGNRWYEGVIDAANPNGGRFFILGDEVDHGWEPDELPALERHEQVELRVVFREEEFRVNCEVESISEDGEGLFLYLRLNFLDDGERDIRRLRYYLGMLS